MKVLQLYYKLPFPGEDGGAIAILSATKSLQEAGVEVTVLALNQITQPAQESAIPHEFVEQTNLQWVVIDNRVTIFGALKSLVTKTSYFSARFYSNEFQRLIEKVLHENEFDVVQLEHLYLCQYISCIRLKSKAKIILRPQNVEHLLWDRIVKSKKNWFVKFWLSKEIKKLKKIELEVVEEVDGIVAISHEDGIFFKQQKTSGIVDAISVAMDFMPFKSSERADRKIRFYHLGSMDWTPNVDGLDWFFSEVASLFGENKFDNSEFYFSGRNMPNRFLQKNNSRTFFISGRIASASEFIKDKDVLLVPILSGGGVRVKILEALAAGKVVISTAAGSKGIPDDLLKFILIADSPVDFLAMIGRVSENLEFYKEQSEILANDFKEKISHQAIGRCYLAFYEKILT
jgi:glycosyltransferase involved in cell wall biosynthesis